MQLLDLIESEDKSSPFLNCLRNNYRHLKKWAKRTTTDCFRIYDRDLHHFPLAIDYYAGRFCIHFYSKGIDEEEAPPVLTVETEDVLHKLFGVTPDSIYWRTRKRRKETRQYEKADAQREFFTVVEYGVKFWVNLTDYLDTGLFLDHRETRQMVAKEANEKRLLNLFAYTCSFSVHAAAAGADFTKSVDMSNTYTEWGRDNFALNQMSSTSNVVVRADCMRFLEEERAKYDLIVIDPPTISRSKKMEGLFDVQMDYVYLISKSLELLTPGGCIYFSTNSRRFQFDDQHFPDATVKELSHKTLPVDFKDSKIHRCWKIS